jgi:formiminotetrahydrofolate cyclodeaminase
MAERITFDHESLREFFAALASGDAPQDAVTAAGVAAAMGTSLLLFVAGLPKTKSDSLDDRTALATAAAGLGDVREQLLEAIDTDTAVKMFAARRMPHASENERAAREAAMQLALRAAAEVPLEVVRLSTQALTHAERVAAHASRAGAVDLELAVALIRTGLEGARANLEAKLSTLTNVVYTEKVVEEIARLSEEAFHAGQTIEKLAKVPPA